MLVRDSPWPLHSGIAGTGPMSEIRVATIEDAEQINRVSAHLGYQQSSNEAAGKRLAEIMESTSDHVWVYEEEGEVKGWLHLFVALRLASPGFAEIGGLVVAPSRRRSGIGRKLVERALEWSKASNLELRVRCNASREEANRFYRSIGFESLKTQQVHRKS